MQLVGAGEDAAAERGAPGLGPAARRRRTPPSSGRRARSPRCARSRVEENNLADALRAAVAVPDPAATVELTAALAGFWTVRGENTRVIAIAAAVDAALTGLGAGAGRGRRRGHRGRRHGAQHHGGRDRERAVVPGAPGEVRRPDDRTACRGMVAVLAAQDVDDPSGTLERLALIDAGARLRPRVRRDGAAVVGALPRERRRPRAGPRGGRPAAWPWSRTRRGPGSGR